MSDLFFTPDMAALFGDIEIDRRRYREIIRGNVRKELRKFLSSEDIVTQRGKDKISIPIRRIDTPRFVHGSQQGEGVGQGEGEPGDVLGQDQAQGDGQGKQAGEQAGDHMTEELSLEEFADIMSEELELPRIKPKGKESLETIEDAYLDVRRTGPESLRITRRTLREALIREMAGGEYDPEDPVIIPIRDDFRYRAPKTRPKPRTNAVIIYIIDVSGSMGEFEKQMARRTSAGIDLWLDANYKGCEKVFIIHDVNAKEVDRDTFFTTTVSGGTRISSSYEMAAEIITNRYPPSKWNSYLVHFSDGENIYNDNDRCLDILREKLLPQVNLFAYGQIQPNEEYGGSFLENLETAFEGREEVSLATITGPDDIPDTLKTFFSKGR